MDNRLIGTILDTDSYKFSHWKQYPKGTTAMYSYFESRGGRWDKTVFFGLQYYLEKYFTKPITKDEVEEANEFANLHGCPFNYDGWMYIVNEYKGFLPIRIKAIPEGSIIPTKNVLFSVESIKDDPKCFWVVSWIETMLVRLWYPLTIATYSYNTKQIIMKYLEETSDDPKGEIDFKLHDFGSRGVTCQEQAMIGGAAHLINFKGSDTVAGIWMANKFYKEKMAGFSIPAAEHSTMSMWGKDNEVGAYRNMIAQYGDTGIFACVSDTWNIYNAAEKLWGEELKDAVMSMKATLVVRPDSGDPVEVVKELLKILDNKFGSTLNTKGYKVLNKVRVIQGDGINADILEKILIMAKENGYSATNLAFGMGGGLLQKDFDRDTQKIAFKCSWAKINGKDVEVFKSPITDKVKKSKKGKLALCVMNGRKIRTLPEDAVSDSENLLRTVYENGEIKLYTTFQEVRENTKKVYEQYNGWVNKDIY